MSDLIDSLSRNLRGYWCPMLQYGGLVLRDQTRFKNHGTLTNMDVSSDWVMSRVQGRSGRVLDFDGTNDHVTLPSVEPLQSLQVPMTIAAWVYKSSGSNGGVFTQYSNVVGHKLVKLAAFSTTEFSYYASTSGGGFQRVAFSTIPALNTWHLLTWIVQGTLASPTCRLSADGVEQSFSLSALSTTPDVTVPLRIACTSLSGVPSEFNQTRIADLAIWDRAILLAEIREIYRLGPGWYKPQLPRRIPYSEQQAGFRAYWARRQSQLIGGGV